MKFEEALKAMREGKNVRRKGFKGSYYMKNGSLISLDENSSIVVADGVTITGILSDEWEIAGEDCALKETNMDKIDIKITFIGGGEIVIPDEQWDDYRYDGKFFTIIKGGADIAMYNAKEVFSLVLVRQGRKN